MLEKETRLKTRTGSISVQGLVSNTGTLSVDLGQGQKGGIRLESANEVIALVDTLNALLTAAAGIPPLAAEAAPG